MYLELDLLSKQFDGKYAVHDLSLGLEEGGLLCILGSSGCGKTTTLNMIGGFLKPDGGRVLLDRQDITALPPERRPVSTVFQSYGLFPHMSVLQNVTYGLKFRRYSRAEAREKGRRYLELVGLAERENARIGELSGGQQQHSPARSSSSQSSACLTSRSRTSTRRCACGCAASSSVCSASSAPRWSSSRTIRRRRSFWLTPSP